MYMYIMSKVEMYKPMSEKMTKLKMPKAEMSKIVAMSK